MNFGKAIRICRATKGISQKELAEIANIGPSYVSLIEAGKRSPSIATIEKIGKALAVPTHLIMLLATERQEIRGDNFQNLQEASRLILQLLLDSDSETPSDKAGS